MAKGLLEEFTNGIKHAIEDIRHKLVEEAWFGRETTDTVRDTAGHNRPEFPQGMMGHHIHVTPSQGTAIHPSGHTQDAEATRRFEAFAGIEPAREAHMPQIAQEQDYEIER